MNYSTDKRYRTRRLNQVKRVIRLHRQELKDDKKFQMVICVEIIVVLYFVFLALTLVLMT
jgi:hypothetical protein